MLWRYVRAEGVHFPVEPVVNKTAESEWWAAREHDRATIYDAGLPHAWDWGDSPADLAQKAYCTPSSHKLSWTQLGGHLLNVLTRGLFLLRSADSMRNRLLWEVYGAERKVFDTRVTLFSASGTLRLLFLRCVPSSRSVLTQERIPPLFEVDQNMPSCLLNTWRPSASPCPTSMSVAPVPGAPVLWSLNCLTGL